MRLGISAVVSLVILSGCMGAGDDVVELRVVRAAYAEAMCEWFRGDDAVKFSWDVITDYLWGCALYEVENGPDTALMPWSQGERANMSAEIEPLENGHTLVYVHGAPDVTQPILFDGFTHGLFRISPVDVESSMSWNVNGRDVVFPAITLSSFGVRNATGCPHAPGMTCGEVVANLTNDLFVEVREVVIVEVEQTSGELANAKPTRALIAAKGAGEIAIEMQWPAHDAPRRILVETPHALLLGPGLSRDDEGWISSS